MKPPPRIIHVRGIFFIKKFYDLLSTKKRIIFVE